MEFRRVEDIPCLFMKRHVHFIYGLIRSFRPTAVVEVGTYYGYVAAYVAKALQENGDDGKLYVIDNFSLGSEAHHVHNHLAALGVGNCVTIHKADSKDVNWPSCSVAIIDGDHSYEGVLHDFKSAVMAGAVHIILHDVASWWGPRELVDQLKLESKEWQVTVFPYDQGLALISRIPELPPLEYTKEAYPTGAV